VEKLTKNLHHIKLTDMHDRLSQLIGDITAREAANIWSFTLAMALALWGYVADFSYRALRGKTRTPYWKAFLMDFPGASLLAILTYGACTSAGIHGWALAALVGMAGHIGGRGIYQIEQVVISLLVNKYGLKKEGVRTDDD